MAFDPQRIMDSIAQAGSLLQEQWKKPGGSMPENNLHPDAAHLQFRIKVIEDRLDTVEKLLGQIVRAMKNGGQ